MPPLPDVQSRTTPRGDVYTTYTWRLLQFERPVLRREYAYNGEPTAIDLVREIMNTAAPVLYDTYKRVILGRSDNGDIGDSAISTSFHGDASDVIDDLTEKIENVTLRYDDHSHIVVDILQIMTMTPNPQNGAGGMRRTDANEIWLVPGEWNTQQNCFYVSWAMLLNKERFAVQYADWLEGKQESYPAFKESAHHKKRYMEAAMQKAGESFRRAYVDNEQIRLIAAHSKPSPIVHVYGGQFQKLYDTSTDAANEASSTGKRVRRMPGPLFEMQRSQNHYRPMIRWSDLDASLTERIKTALARKVEPPPRLQSAVKIRETFKGKESRNLRFVAWDLEATVDADGGFKCYAAGMAWYRAPFADEGEEPPDVDVHLDGSQEMLYVSFWGMDALKLMLHFLLMHQTYFNESYFWAHNGGKFDLPLLLREALFDCEHARIEGERCTILNGRWIGFQALLLSPDSGESRIYFRDSCAILMGALDKLCKDYGVPHQKLAETVCHDDITLDNWHTFPQLRQYLAHDCLGLLELVDRFGAEIFEMSWTEKVERHHGERNTANVLEALLSLPPGSFTKQRPT